MERLMLVAIAFLNLASLGTSRVQALVRLVALQGILTGVLPLFAHSEHLGVRLLLLSAVIIGLKGFGFPWLLSRALREAEVRHEDDPYIGYTSSVLAGLCGFGVSLLLAGRLPHLVPDADELVVPIGLFTILTGFLVLVTRRKAVTQVLGYLVLENGIFAFGLAFAQEQPFLVEMGVLLDAFVAVSVMGMTIFHMNRTVEHLDTDRLSTLRD